MQGFQDYAIGDDPSPYLEGHGDLVGRLITPISHRITPVILIINPFTKSPCPSKYSTHEP